MKRMVAKAEGFDNEADQWLDRIVNNFRDELTQETLDTSDNQWATADDVFDALDVVMNSDAAWAKKPRPLKKCGVCGGQVVAILPGHYCLHCDCDRSVKR